MSSSTIRPFPSLRRGPADRSRLTPQQRWGALVVGAPIALTLAVFVHPHEDSESARSLHVIDEQRVRWVTAHLVEPFAWLAIAVVLALVGRRSVGRASGLVRIGGSLAALGAAAMSLIVYGHGEAFRFMSEQPAEFGAMERLYGRFYDGVPLVGPIAPAFQVGMILLGAGLLRSRAVPRWAGVAILAVPVAIVVVGPVLSPPWAAVVIGLPFVAGFAGIRSAVVGAHAPDAARLVL